MNESPSLGACATLACVWEATAPKPGNVHRGADFEDMTYADFLTSAAVIGPVINRCGELGLGRTVLEAVKATRQAVNVNTNLGTLLLLAPVAMPASAGGGDLTNVITSATDEETQLIYEAIRLASPGGMGQVAEGDIATAPQHSLLEAMQLAADRDLVARQYTNGFNEVQSAADQIDQSLRRGDALADAIVQAQLQLLATHGDSLIARKLGDAMSAEVANRSRAVLAASSENRTAALADFDFWLRSDGHRRNPGTTADLIAAALFVLLVENRISWPVRFYPTYRDQ